MKLRDKLERALDYHITIEIIDKKMNSETIKLLIPTIVYDILRYRFDNLHIKLKQMLNLESDQELLKFLKEILKVLLITHTFGEEKIIHLDTTLPREDYNTYIMHTLIYDIVKYLEERGFVKIIFSKHGRNQLDEFDVNQLLLIFKHVFAYEID